MDRDVAAALYFHIGLSYIEILGALPINHRILIGEDGSEDKKKVAILLTVAGAEAQEVFRTFTYEPAKAAVGNQPAVPAETAEQFNTIVRKFTEFCVPRKNVIYERYAFHTRVQGEGRQSLIGASDSERLGLATRECGVRKVCTVKENGVLTSAEIKKEYPDIFKGLGCLEGTCKIHLRQN
ncbi:hypothetical protein NP493_1280g00019 [Ridgeia piscesae]|uniref:Uncharacterized protein n=1 Tax=Ridgeia piscesae TaxID=27915 RepID=A0AAD9K9L8_RIDPI|nr:hypothetical protein NP493_1280g00019 [Ridgeia piscesae]